MAVNYETPDPGIQERQYVQQIPLDDLFRNLAYKQSQYDSGYQQAKQKLDVVNNIASYGHDTDVKNQLIGELNGELEKFNGANFGDKDITSNLDAAVNNFTNSKDIAGIHARATMMNKMLQEEQAASIKGQEYYNPGLNQARQYFANGAYDKGARFNDQGNLAPDMVKLTDNIMKMPQVKYTTEEIDPKDPTHKITVDHVDGDKAMQAFNYLAGADPKLSKYLNAKFLEEHPGSQNDPQYFTKTALAKYTNLLNNAKDLASSAEEAYGLASSSKTSYPKAKLADLLQKKEDADKLRDYYSDMLNPSDGSVPTEGMFRADLFNDTKQAMSRNLGNMMNLSVRSKIDGDNVAIEKMKMANELQKIQYETYKENNIDPITRQPVDISNSTKNTGKTYSINGTQYIGNEVVQNTSDAFDKGNSNTWVEDQIKEHMKKVGEKDLPENWYHIAMEKQKDGSFKAHVQVYNPKTPEKVRTDKTYNEDQFWATVGGKTQYSKDIEHYYTTKYTNLPSDPTTHLKIAVNPDEVKTIPPGHQYLKLSDDKKSYVVTTKP